MIIRERNAQEKAKKEKEKEKIIEEIKKIERPTWRNHLPKSVSIAAADLS